MVPLSFLHETLLPFLRYRVAYPTELRLFNTTDDAVDGDRLYDLVAVVVHVGSRQVLLPRCRNTHRDASQAVLVMLAWL